MITNKKYLYLGAAVLIAISLSVGNISPLFLLLLACPLMMFMMHGKGGHDMGQSKDHDMEDKNK